MSRPLGITLLAEYYLPRLGGVEIFVSDLAKALASRGHRVRVVTTTPSSADAAGSRIPTVEATSDSGVEVVRVPSWNVPALGVPLSPKLPGRIRTALEGDRPDVVHVHASIASAGALAAGWAAHTLELPMVATFHSVLGPWSWVHRMAHGLTGWGRWPGVVAGVSGPVAEEVSQVLGRPAEVLPNAVDVAWWRAGATREPRRDPRTLRVVGVQRLKARKRADALVSIVAQVQAELPENHRVVLTLVGDGPRRRAVEARAARMGVAVDFRGALGREDVRTALREADVFVLASREEAFGLAAVEARAAGLPVVAFRTGGLPAIVEHDASGVLVASDAGMVRALFRLATEPRRLARMRDYAETHPPPFDWGQVVALHEASYREAILRSGQAGS